MTKLKCASKLNAIYIRVQCILIFIYCSKVYVYLEHLSTSHRCHTGNSIQELCPEHKKAEDAKSHEKMENFRSFCLPMPHIIT